MEESKRIPNDLKDPIILKNDRGPNDLEETIDKLKKQVELLQFQCRKAGKALVDQEIKIASLIKDLDRASEERDNFQRVLGDGKDDTR